MEQFSFERFRWHLPSLVSRGLGFSIQLYNINAAVIRLWVASNIALILFTFVFILYCYIYYGLIVVYLGNILCWYDVGLYLPSTVFNYTISINVFSLFMQSLFVSDRNCRGKEKSPVLPLLHLLGIMDTVLSGGKPWIPDFQMRGLSNHIGLQLLSSSPCRIWVL